MTKEIFPSAGLRAVYEQFHLQRKFLVAQMQMHLQTKVDAGIKYHPAYTTKRTSIFFKRQCDNFCDYIGLAVNFSEETTKFRLATKRKVCNNVGHVVMGIIDHEQGTFYAFDFTPQQTLQYLDCPIELIQHFGPTTDLDELLEILLCTYKTEESSPLTWDSSGFYNDRLNANEKNNKLDEVKRLILEKVETFCLLSED